MANPEYTSKEEMLAEMMRPKTEREFKLPDIMPDYLTNATVRFVFREGQRWRTERGGVARVNSISGSGAWVTVDTKNGAHTYRVNELGKAESSEGGENLIEIVPISAVKSPSTNPKDAIGNVKLPLHLWPAEATALGCLGMLEGALKYGRNNYVSGDGVIASIYVAACLRHIALWFSGQELSSDVNGDHIGNALACLAIIAKARAHGKLIDDRDFSGSPDAYGKLVEELTPQVKRLQELFADKNPRHFTIADNQKE